MPTVDLILALTLVVVGVTGLICFLLDSYIHIKISEQEAAFDRHCEEAISLANSK